MFDLTTEQNPPHIHQNTMTSHITYDGPNTLKANQLFSAIIRIRTEKVLATGARVVIAVRHFSDFGVPQMENPSAENYISVSSTGDGDQWNLGPANDWRRHPWNRGLDLRLKKGSLPAGETLAVELGDTSGGSPGYRTQSFTESAFRFRLGIDADGSGNWEVLSPEECPPIRILGNEASGLKVVANRPTEVAEALSVRIKPEDPYGNISGEASGCVSLMLDDTEPLRTVQLESNRAAETAVDIPKDGWHVITAATDDGRFWSRSNPVGPSPMAGYELYFGEIHGQSGLCDGTNSPSEIYEYARTAAGLDFASVSSHDFELTDEDWREIKHATREANRPGEFVTFPGYEWSGKPPAGGDNNIYFLNDDAPLVYSAPFGGYDAWDPAECQVNRARDLGEVIEELQGHRFMVVPHCGGRQCNLDYYDPEVMPMFEIHSCHRTYEHVAREALRRGMRVGFVAGSDDHRGALGDSHAAARDTFFSTHNGLVAAYAEGLSREDLWDAFFARRVYATNGPRIVLDVRINETPMGGELADAPGTPAKLSFFTRLDGMFERAEIVQDDAVVRTLVADTNQVVEFDGELDLEIDTSPHAYYVRVFQVDGGRAWSSPIWVTPEEA